MAVRRERLLDMLQVLSEGGFICILDREGLELVRARIEKVVRTEGRLSLTVESAPVLLTGHAQKAVLYESDGIALADLSVGMAFKDEDPPDLLFDSTAFLRGDRCSLTLTGG